MSEYTDKLEDTEFFRTLTKDYVLTEIIPRVEKAIEDFGRGWYDQGEIHTAEIEALLKFIAGKLQ